jgi:hypothetical protein
MAKLQLQQKVCLISVAATLLLPALLLLLLQCVSTCGSISRSPTQMGPAHLPAAGCNNLLVEVTINMTQTQSVPSAAACDKISGGLCCGFAVMVSAVAALYKEKLLSCSQRDPSAPAIHGLNLYCTTERVGVLASKELLVSAALLWL